MSKAIYVNEFGRVHTGDGWGLEIEQVPELNPVSDKIRNQHNIYLVNGDPKAAKLVGAYGSQYEAEDAYEAAAEEDTLEDALAVLDERSLHLYHLHFSEPLVTNWNKPQHYTGCTKNLARRLKHHRSGHTVPVVREVVDRGAKLTVAWQKIGGWYEERLFKARKNGRRYCPICNKEHGNND